MLTSLGSLKVPGGFINIYEQHGTRRHSQRRSSAGTAAKEQPPSRSQSSPNERGKRARLKKERARREAEAAVAAVNADAGTGAEGGAELFARLSATSPEVRREGYY